jgi:lipopolysaccharide export system protein LptA
MSMNSASSYRMMYRLPFNCSNLGARTSWWIIFVVMIIFLICFSVGGSYGQTLPDTLEKLPAQKGCEGNAAMLNVSATRMTFDSKTRTFIFEEKVRVLRCTMAIACDRLQVINGASEKNIERIIATGNVQFEQGTRSGVAERADYFEAEQKLVLTGNPRIWDTQEHNELTGEEIVVLLQNEKVLVKQARVLFHPRKTPIKAP